MGAEVAFGAVVAAGATVAVGAVGVITGVVACGRVGIGFASGWAASNSCRRVTASEVIVLEYERVKFSSSARASLYLPCASSNRAMPSRACGTTFWLG